MNYSEIKYLMGLVQLSPHQIASETGKPRGDVTVCFQQTRRYQPLREKIEEIFFNSFYKHFLDRSIQSKDIELILVMVKFPADDVAAAATCSIETIRAWIAGEPMPKRELKKIAGCVSKRIKISLFKSSLEAATV